MTKAEKKWLQILFKELGVDISFLLKSLKVKKSTPKIAPDKRDVFYTINELPTKSSKVLLVTRNSIVISVMYSRKCKLTQLDAMKQLFSEYYKGEGYSLQSDDSKEIILEKGYKLLEIKTFKSDDDYQIKILLRFKDLQLDDLQN